MWRKKLVYRCDFTRFEVGTRNILHLILKHRNRMAWKTYFYTSSGNKFFLCNTGTYPGFRCEGHLKWKKLYIVRQVFEYLIELQYFYLVRGIPLGTCLIANHFYKTVPAELTGVSFTALFFELFLNI